MKNPIGIKEGILVTPFGNTNAKTFFSFIYQNGTSGIISIEIESNEILKRFKQKLEFFMKDYDNTDTISKIDFIYGGVHFIGSNIISVDKNPEEGNNQVTIAFSSYRKGD